MKDSLYYYNKIPNFGDLLNPFLTKNLFHKEIEYAHPYYAKYYCIGSILEKMIAEDYNYKKQIKKLFIPSLVVYGSGFIKEQTTTKEYYYRNLDIKAVRGKYTLQRFAKNLNKKISVELGDPGLLTSLVPFQSEKKFRVGIIPHYVDKNNPIFTNNRSAISDSLIIDVSESPEVVISKILSCECILSSAMHGLIVADSFCIPNRRLIISDQITGGDYKFNDYYSAFNTEKTVANPIDLRKENISENIITETLKDYKVHPEEIQRIQNNLLKVNPFQ